MPAPSTPTPVAPPRTFGWLRRFDTLGVKLFLAIGGANVVLVMAAYLVHGWSFDKGLVAYLNQADEARLQPLVARLADGHRIHGGWEWVTNDRLRWFELSREVLGSGRLPGRPAEYARRDGPGHAMRPDEPTTGPAPADSTPALTIDPRLLLFDAQRQLLIGPAGRAPQAVLKPIEVDGRVVGHLGYVPRLQMVASLERVFQAQQTQTYAAIALGMLAAVLLNAALIARWLSGRLRALGAGTQAVAQGDYGVRLPAKGHDELARLAGDFNHMAGALQAARQARQHWIADIAHELRTPLATLRAEIEALQDGVRAPDRASLDSLAQEVGRLTRLVDDLRLLSMSDLGALDYRLAPVDLGKLVKRYLDDHPGPGLAVQHELAPGLVVRADEDRLRQVLANLAQNTLRYSTSPAALRVTLAREAHQARLSWEDSAPGVPDDALLRLTERLYRVDASRASASGGSGLGLAIARAIVEGHGGRMQASHSALGGLRWDIWLPLHGEPAHD
jgi:two-component system sensor histidine kinase BaeS